MAAALHDIEPCGGAMTRHVSRAPRRATHAMVLSQSRNALIQHLSRTERDRLRPHITVAPLRLRQILVEAGKPSAHAYFPESGVLSMVTSLPGGQAVETATIGREGFVGITAVLHGAPSPGTVLCQIPGRALRLPASVLEDERRRGQPWMSRLLRYVSFLMAMIGQTAACNRNHDLEARLGRWLLMTHDRVDTDDFPLTQEFLATMLGVSRPLVHAACAALERAGFIEYSRGRIKLIDRKGLRSASCECYDRLRAEYVRTVLRITPLAAGLAAPAGARRRPPA